jgi:hypothetical protein
MRLLSWLRGLPPWGNRLGCRARTQAPSYRPVVEILEDRLTPAVSYSYGAGTLGVFLNSVNDTTEIRAASSAGNDFSWARSAR